MAREITRMFKRPLLGFADTVQRGDAENAEENA
jgi:hypothetical protein